MMMHDAKMSQSARTACTHPTSAFVASPGPRLRLVWKAGLLKAQVTAFASRTLGHVAQAPPHPPRTMSLFGDSDEDTLTPPETWASPASPRVRFTSDGAGVGAGAASGAGAGAGGTAGDGDAAAAAPPDEPCGLDAEAVKAQMTEIRPLDPPEEDVQLKEVRGTNVARVWASAVCAFVLTLLLRARSLL